MPARQLRDERVAPVIVVVGIYVGLYAVVRPLLGPVAAGLTPDFVRRRLLREKINSLRDDDKELAWGGSVDALLGWLQRNPDVPPPPAAPRADPAETAAAAPSPPAVDPAQRLDVDRSLGRIEDPVEQLAQYILISGSPPPKQLAPPGEYRDTRRILRVLHVDLAILLVGPTSTSR